MPLHFGQNYKGPYFQYGDDGTKYYYKLRDNDSRDLAISKAARQAIAIKLNTMYIPKEDVGDIFPFLSQYERGHRVERENKERRKKEDEIYMNISKKKMEQEDKYIRDIMKNREEEALYIDNLIKDYERKNPPNPKNLNLMDIEHEILPETIESLPTPLRGPYKERDLTYPNERLFHPDERLFNPDQIKQLIDKAARKRHEEEAMAENERMQEREHIKQRNHKVQQKMKLRQQENALMKREKERASQQEDYLMRKLEDELVHKLDTAYDNPPPTKTLGKLREKNKKKHKKH